MERTRPRGAAPGIALLPLRLFLGGTFVYAGIQKLSDPGFLHPGAPTYIGTQLHAFASGTPGGFILRALAIPHAELAGIGVAIAEIAIGLCAFFGLLTRWAAAAGMALNFLLFLTASWHTSPYFLGPDIVFTFAWLPFVLTGARGQPAFDHVIERGSPELVRRTRMHPDAGPRGLDPTESSVLTRRALLIQTGIATLSLAGIAALAKGSYHGATTASAGAGSTEGSGASGGPAGTRREARRRSPPPCPPARSGWARRIASARGRRPSTGTPRPASRTS